MDPEKKIEPLPIGTAILVPVTKQLYGLCRIVRLEQGVPWFEKEKRWLYLALASEWIGRRDELDLQSKEAQTPHKTQMTGGHYENFWAWIYFAPLPPDFLVVGQIEPSPDEQKVDVSRLLIPLMNSNVAMLRWETVQETFQGKVLANHQTRLRMRENIKLAAAAGRQARNEANPPMAMGGFAGSRSGYTIVDGIVHWNGGALMKADGDSFENLAPSWGLDKNSVWVQNEALKRIHRASFRLLNAIFAVDAKGIHMPYRSMKSGDPKTFEPLDAGASFDSSGFGLELEADFKGYGRDAKKVYFHKQTWDIRNELAGADPATFRSFGNGFGADEKGVFCGPLRIPKANPKTWRRIGGDYSADDQRLFDGNKEILLKGKTLAHVLSIDGKLVLLDEQKKELGPTRGSGAVSEFVREGFERHLELLKTRYSIEFDE